ncbi:hypothetical protein BC831DRAFT_472256 [Entophlyctis helioformis]|nr:hypothetical protein BC831DRAFT_472256 [Entophlyctis helioformis]
MRQLASGNTLSTGRRGRCPKVGRVACRRAKRKLARWWLHAKGEGDLRWPAPMPICCPCCCCCFCCCPNPNDMLVPDDCWPNAGCCGCWLSKPLDAWPNTDAPLDPKPAGRLSKGWRCRRRTTTAAAKRIGRRRRCSKPWLASKRASWRGRRLRSKRKLRRWRCRWGRLARTKHKRAGRGWRATDSHAKPAWCLACRLPTKAPESTAKAWRCACWARRCAGEARRGCALLRRRFGNRRRPKSKAACCCGCRLRCRWSSSKETAGRCWRSRSSRRERWSRTKCER